MHCSVCNVNDNPHTAPLKVATQASICSAQDQLVLALAKEAGLTMLFGLQTTRCTHNRQASLHSLTRCHESLSFAYPSAAQGVVCCLISSTGCCLLTHEQHRMSFAYRSTAHNVVRLLISSTGCRLLTHEQHRMSCNPALIHFVVCRTAYELCYSRRGHSLLAVTTVRSDEASAIIYAPGLVGRARSDWTRATYCYCYAPALHHI